MKKAKESQNQIQFDLYDKDPVMLGPYTSYMWRTDPKHIGFLFSRYKFVSKLLAGKKEILEVGCGDATGTPLVACVADQVYCTDFEPLLMDDNRKRLHHFPNITFELLDVTKKPFRKRCDGVFALDVIEHIRPSAEGYFFKHICASLKEDGICIVGTPNKEAFKYASRGSREGHVNLKNYQDFQKILKKYFHNGFIFSMNDEVIHTGFYPMAHYLIAVGISPCK